MRSDLYVCVHPDDLEEFENSAKKYMPDNSSLNVVKEIYHPRGIFTVFENSLLMGILSLSKPDRVRRGIIGIFNIKDWSRYEPEEDEEKNGLESTSP